MTSKITNINETIQPKVPWIVKKKTSSLKSESKTNTNNKKVRTNSWSTKEETINVEFVTTFGKYKQGELVDITTKELDSINWIYYRVTGK